ncbi:hypothetical protein BY996DRAFT_6586146 [Phakopsora pachyrhizi]|nr:hypothetical protein BY996DRAFT_6586146 [Phakopsora pachyrhizi]
MYTVSLHRAVTQILLPVRTSAEPLRSQASTVPRAASQTHTLAVAAPTNTPYPEDFPAEVLKAFPAATTSTKNYLALRTSLLKQPSYYLGCH